MGQKRQPKGTMMKWPPSVTGFFGFAKHVIKAYSDDNGSLAAAAVSFYAAQSIIPLSLLCLSVAALFLGSAEQAKEVLLHLAKGYYPVAVGHYGSVIHRVIDEVVRGRAAVTGLSAVLLLWSGISLMNTICRVVNVAWDIRTRRGFFMQKLVDLLLLVATVALLGVSLGMTAFVELVKGLDIRIFGLSAHDFPLAWKMLGYLIPFVVTILAFTVVYKVAPNVVVPTRVALFGAVFAGIMWEVAKIAFGYYVSRIATGFSIYGSLGGVLLFLVWINYSSKVTVIGAEIASEWQKQRDR